VKILLLSPCSPSSLQIKFPPLGLLYLAGFLRARIPEVQVEVLDAHLHRLTNQQVAHEVRRRAPHLLGITYSSFNHQRVLDLAHLLRPMGIPIILGGPQARVYASELIQNPDIDYLVIGEGELPLAGLVEHLCDGRPVSEINISGVIREGQPGEHPAGADPTVIDDVDEIPFPAWDLVDPEEYFTPGRKNSLGTLPYSPRVLPVLTTRGCPFSCTYCYHVFGKRYRVRSASNVVDEIEHLIRSYGVEQVDIVDDNFNFDRQRLDDLCALISSREIKVRFSFSTGIRADLLDHDIIDKLVECGLFRINVAIESVSEEMRARLNRRFDWEQTQGVIDYLSRQDIILGGLFILGCPGETEQQVLDTIRYAADSRMHLADFSLLTVLRGTRLYEELSEEQRRAYDALPPDALGYDQLPVNLSEVPDARLMQLQRRAYLDFYARPRRATWLLRRMGPRGVLRNAASFLRFLARPGERLRFHSA